MIRKAIIVASPLKKGQRGFLPGVEVDVENYKSFLTSPVGGSWLPNEIQVLWNPSSTKVAEVMSNTRAHYTFTAYSGHGGTDGKTGKAYLNINSSEAVWVSRLAAHSMRQLMIIDACSTYAYPGISGLGDPEAMIKFSSSLTSSQSRKIFEHRVSSTPHGWTIVHSSSPGQASLDTPEGGLFSQSLLRSVSNWGAKYEANSILPVPVAYQYSHNYLKNAYQAEQTPRIWHSKSQPVFPFAFRFGTELRK